MGYRSTILDDLQTFTGLFCIMVALIALAAELYAGWLQDIDREESKDPSISVFVIEYLAFIGITWLIGAPLWQQLTITPLFPALRWFRDYPINTIIHKNVNYISGNQLSDRVLRFFSSRGISPHIVRAIFFFAMLSVSVFLYFNYISHA